MSNFVAGYCSNVIKMQRHLKFRSQVGVTGYTLVTNKNIFYKNIKAEMCDIFKRNILLINPIPRF